MPARVQLSRETYQLLMGMPVADRNALLGVQLFESTRLAGTETWDVKCSVEFVNVIAAEQLPTESFDQALRRTLGWASAASASHALRKTP